jgi:hypothetical protein
VNIIRNITRFFLGNEYIPNRDNPKKAMVWIILSLENENNNLNLLSAFDGSNKSHVKTKK